MTSVNKFFWFMSERLNIQRKREAGEPAPWTEDAVLQKYHFCNVFREDDRISKYWAAHNLRWAGGASARMVGTNTLMFRFFNLPSTWEAIQPSWRTWDPSTLLTKLERAPRPIFNSAYMVTGSTGTGQAKHVSVMQACDTLYKMPSELEKGLKAGSMEVFVEHLRTYPMVGRFMGYEVACDLRMCGHWFPDDVHTWANLGPGALRGLNRIHNRKVTAPLTQSMGLLEMRRLYGDAQKRVERGTLKLPRPLDMRVIEHTLCEFDKYERAWNNGNAHLRVFTPKQ